MTDWHALTADQKRARIDRLRARGQSQRMVAVACGVSRKTVAKFDIVGRRVADARRLSITVGGGLKGRLDALARGRGIQPCTLASRIVAAALRADLVDAILDDRPHHREQ